MMSFSYRAKLSKKLNKCTYRPIWSEFCADPLIGNRKPYVSNIAKIAKLDIPEDLPDAGKVISIEQGLEMISKVIKLRK